MKKLSNFLEKIHKKNQIVKKISHKNNNSYILIDFRAEILKLSLIIIEIHTNNIDLDDYAIFLAKKKSTFKRGIILK